jgi:Rrf2 family protein
MWSVICPQTSGPRGRRHFPTPRLRYGVLNQKTRYALRALLHLVEEGDGTPIQLASIATAQRVPPKYLELIMLDLKRAGLVRSIRGPRGGYRLAQTAEEISFGRHIHWSPKSIAM